MLGWNVLDLFVLPDGPSYETREQVYRPVVRNFIESYDSLEG